jgi:mRNA interferase MazF
MIIKQWHIYSANLSPTYGTEAGKTRPVLVIQSNILNKISTSTIIVPITSKILKIIADPIRLNLTIENTGLIKPSALLIDQMRAIDNKRFKEYIGKIDEEQIPTIKQCILEILDLHI